MNENQTKRMQILKTVITITHINIKFPVDFDFKDSTNCTVGLLTMKVTDLA